MREVGTGQEKVRIQQREVCFDLQAPAVLVHQNKAMLSEHYQED